MRRSCPHCGETIEPSDLHVYELARVARRGDQVATVNANEARVLRALDEAAPMPVDGDALQAVIKGRHIRVVVHGLRPKLGRLGLAIETQRGKGYRLKETRP